MVQRHERLDVGFPHGAEQIAVEVDARLERLFLGTRGEQARPLDGNAQALKAHLGKEGDVLLVVMVKIDAVALGVDMRI